MARNPAPVGARAAERCAWLKHMVDAGGIGRILGRWGCSTASATRCPAPPRGWYLPVVAEGGAKLDCFEFIEELKIATTTSSTPITPAITLLRAHG